MKQKLEFLYTNGKTFKISGVYDVITEPSGVCYCYTGEGGMLCAVRVPDKDLVAVRHSHIDAGLKCIDLTLYKEKCFTKIGQEF